MSYREKEKYRNWQVWQLNTKNDFVGNMRLEMDVKGVDIPDLKADINEHMISKLGAFESRIAGGSRPAAPAAPPEAPPTIVPWMRSSSGSSHSNPGNKPKYVKPILRPKVR